MQADLAQSQSQQQKRTSSATDDASASGKAVMESQDSAKSVAGQANATSSCAVNSSDVTDTIATDTATSRQPSLSPAGFTPFAKNPAKQKRYEAYLAAQKAGTSCKSTVDSEAVVRYIQVCF